MGHLVIKNGNRNNLPQQLLKIYFIQKGKISQDQGSTNDIDFQLHKNGDLKNFENSMAVFEGTGRCKS